MHVAVVSVGDVLVTSWLGSVEQAAVDFLSSIGDAMARERGHCLAQLSIVEAELPPPGLQERQRLLDALEEARAMRRQRA